MSGEVLVSLKRKELQQFMQMLRMPPQFRSTIIAHLLEIRYNADAVERIPSTEKRTVALAIGSANYFVLKATVKMALRTRLESLRARLLNMPSLGKILPPQFSFVTLRNKFIAREQEAKLRLVDIGFMIILNPS